MLLGRDFKILDCTLRDGGYTNDWHFSLDEGKALVRSVSKNNIDAIEIGFVFPNQPKEKVLGRYAFVSPDLLTTLSRERNGGTSTQIGVMINFNDFSGSKVNPAFWTNYLSEDQEEDKRFVRIATVAQDLAASVQFANSLAEIGFDVMVNLMQAHLISEEDFGSLGKLVKGSSLSRLYLADTMGAMNPGEVRVKLEKLHAETGLPVGFHGHDNLGLALANSLAASEVHMVGGGAMIDGTLAGVGRGAGNTSTESLVATKLSRFRQGETQTDSFLELCELSNRVFAENQAVDFSKKLFMFSAILQAHPNYALALSKEKGNSLGDNWRVLSSLNSSDRSTFREHKVDVATNWYTNRNSFDYKDVEGDHEEFLLVAPGPYAEEYSADIQNFISKRSLAAGTLSVEKKSAASQFSYYFVCNPLHIMRDGLSNPYDNVVAPFHQIPEVYLPNSSLKNRIPFGLTKTEGKMLLDKKGADLPSSRVFSYALSYLIMIGVKTIYLAGFDGIEENNQANREFELFLKRSAVLYPEVTFLTLTPSKYSLESGNLFS